MAGTRLLIAVILIAGAAAAAAFAGRRPDAPVAQTRPAGTRGSSIDSIEIAMRGTDRFALRRAGERWIVAGDSLPADPVRVRRLLGELDALSIDGPVARDPGSHSALGVATEQAVHVVARAGETAVLDLRVGAGGFVRIADGAEVWRLDSAGALADLFAGRDSWEDRAILQLPVGSIDRVAIERGGARLELARDGGAWSVAAGRIGAELDQALAERLAAQLERLEALDITTETGGLDRPLVRVRATADGAVRTLLLGPANDGVHRARLDDGPIWVAASPLVELLDRAPADWRDLRLVRAEGDAIDEVRVADGREVSMTRGDLGWACAGGKQVDRDVAVDLVDAARTLRGERVTAAAIEGSIRLSVSASGRREVVELARARSGWLARAGRSAPVTLSDDAAGALLAAARALAGVCGP